MLRCSKPGGWTAMDGGSLGRLPAARMTANKNPACAGLRARLHGLITD